MAHSTTSILNQNRNTLFTTFTSTPSHSHSSSHFFKKPQLSLLLSNPHAPPLCFRVTRVSTAPVEYEPPAPDFNFHEESSRLKSLRSKLSNCRTLREKLRVINSDSRVKQFFNEVNCEFSRFNLSSGELYLLKCLVAAGQEHVISSGLEVLERREGTTRGAMKSALYALVEMIEKLDGTGSFGKGDLDDEVSVNLKALLKTLAEIERFYDCIGGIIG